MKGPVIFSGKLLTLISFSLALTPGFADSPGLPGSRVGMTNPAAEYCKALGYEYQIIEGVEGQVGFCLLPDQHSCEAWQFLSGTCGAKFSYCALRGMDSQTLSDGQDSLSPEYAVCVTKEKQVVGRVSVLMGLSKLSARSMAGLSSTDSREKLAAPGTILVPSAFDWRNERGHNWMTSVKDQGSCGSCWAFSAVGAMEPDYNVARNNPNLDLDLSEEYLAADCYDMYSCCGGWPYAALDFIKDNGIPDEACFPYGDGGCNSTCFLGVVAATSSLPDARGTLDSLRAFRDADLKPEYAALYYKFNPTLKKIVLSNPGLLIDAGILMVKYMPGLEYLLSQGGLKDFEITKEDTAEVVSFLEKLKWGAREQAQDLLPETSSELIHVLDELIGQVGQARGKTFRQAFCESIYSRLGCAGKAAAASPRIMEEWKCDCDCAYSSGEDGRICSDRTCSQRCPDWASRLWKISARIPVAEDALSIKTALVTRGPLSVCMGIDDEFQGYFDGSVYRCKIEDNNGIRTNHCVVLVGYNDAGGYWIAKNSWGSLWNWTGYFNVGYGECNIETEVESIVINQAPTANAGPNQTPECTGNGAATVWLDGSASSDPDGHTDIVTYRWTEQGAYLASGEKVSVPLAVGLHHITLTVTDTYNATSTDDVSIEVKDTRPPSLTCPPAEELPANASCCAVWDRPATAGDTCDPHPGLTSTPSLPATFCGEGPHQERYSATDAAGHTASCTTEPIVKDVTPPQGAITFPLPGMCFGSPGVPVTVQDTFRDNCDAAILRSYSPPGGPTYAAHGHYQVLLTVSDSSGNATVASTAFDIDMLPPQVQILEPPSGSLVLGKPTGFNIVFLSADEDGALGGIIHEAIKLAGCTIYDGLTYGDQDGLLSDETVVLDQAELCRIAAQCGFTVLPQPVLQVEATDCGGNQGFATRTLRGTVRLKPGICGR